MALTKYDFKKFAILNLFASALWALAFGLSSFYFGGVLSQFAIYITQNKWIAPVILLVLGGITWLYLERATKKRR
jgi:membrane protein DedA with SNARE-associated domain